MPAKAVRKNALALATFFLIAPSLALAAAAIRSTPAIEGVRAQIATSLESWRSARSASDWDTHPHHPEKIIARLLSSGSEDQIAQFCAALAGLTEQDLSLFETSLEEYDDPRIHCLGTSKARLNSYWVTKIQESKQRSRMKEGTLSPPNATRVAMVHRESLASGQLIGRRLRNATPHFQAIPLQPHEIAITLDDGPSSSYTPFFLRELAERGIRANFFQVGRRLNMNYREPIRADLGSRPDEELTNGKKFSRFMLSQEHSIGSHSMSHADLGRSPMTAAHAEILETESILIRALGLSEIPLFRFPFGSTNAELTDWVHHQGMIPFYWDIDTNDWRDQSDEHLSAEIDRLLERFPFDRAGAIILMHDIHARTAAAFPHFLDKITKMGLTPVVFSATAAAPLP